MRQDVQFKKRVRGFISDTLKDVRKSEKSVFRYFNPSFKNKKLFKYNASWANLRPGHAGSLFGTDNKAGLRWTNLTEVMFGQMMREAKLKRVYLLMPDKEGEFRSSQSKLLTHFTDLILNKMEEREEVIEKNEAEGKKMEPGKSKTKAEIEELITKTQKNLIENGKLETISQLKYNEETGLVEGIFANIMDPVNTTMNVSVDPENEDMILFSSTNLGIRFVIGNNPNELMAFQNKPTEEMIRTNDIEVAKDFRNLNEEEEKAGVNISDGTFGTFREIQEPAIAAEGLELREEGNGNFKDKEIEKTWGDNTYKMPEVERGNLASGSTPKLQEKFQRNTAFEANLKGEMPISTFVKGADGQKRERLPEENLAKREEQQAIEKNLTQKQQDTLKEEQKMAKKQEKQGGGMIGKVAKIGIPVAIGLPAFLS